jgi:glycosyltransferase involved in cell wall biosynthesis
MAMADPRATPRRIGIVLPAKDEQRSIGACLVSIAEAAAHVQQSVTVLAVLDNCSDGSVDVVRRFASKTAHLEVDYLEIEADSVGYARWVGMATLISRLGACGTWLATTDSDSTVPPQWLSTQLRHAASGAEVVLGTVTVDDWRDRSSGLQARAARRYGDSDNPNCHRHIHGANLSCSATAYLAAGGFPDRRCDEDVALVRAFRRNSEPIAWAIDLPVTTSARREARAPGGFAAYLTALESETS